MEAWEQVASNLEDWEQKEIVFFTGPQRNESIVALEQAIGYSLPVSYRAFVLRFGAGGAPGMSINGIYNNAPFQEGIGNVYYDTIRAREEINLPENYLPIYHDPDTEVFWCLDMKHQSEYECPVISFDPDKGRSYPVETNFLKFIQWHWKDLEEDE